MVILVLILVLEMSFLGEGLSEVERALFPSEWSKTNPGICSDLPLSTGSGLIKSEFRWFFKKILGNIVAALTR